MFYVCCVLLVICPYCTTELKEKKLLFAVSPNIEHGPQNYTVIDTERKNVTMYCNATGRPAARLYWVRVRDGTTVASGNTLHITAADRSDRGEYRCVADNGVGSPAIKSAYLDVHCEFFFSSFFFTKLDKLCC